MGRARSCVLALLATLSPALAAAQAAEDLQGAWRVAEMLLPGGGRIASPQPGLLLFAGRHYSYTLVNGEEPRPDLPEGVVPAAVLLAVWQPFSANAGTFEISGDTMTRRPIVAKDPNAMAPGAFNEYTFRIQGDTLWTTPTRTESGPARNPPTTRYVRVR
jgi:hypothetical protein